MGQPHEHNSAFDHTDDAQKDLLAMIAAGRDLSPEMDKALVKSYMAHHAQPASPSATAPQMSPQMSPQIAGQLETRSLGISRVVPLVAVLVIYVAALVATSGFTWWLIFPFMPVLLGSVFGWEPWDERYRRRARRHQLRHELRSQALTQRYQRRYGMLPPVDAQMPLSTPLPTPLPLPQSWPQPLPASQLPSGATVPGTPTQLPLSGDHPPSAAPSAPAPGQPPHNPAG